jgi:GNAT superfamily N-acetyltransferase
LAIDPDLVRAWLTGRSLARGLPEPVQDLGGFRVDTNSEKEARRWVFASLVSGVSDLGLAVSEPRNFIKLCGSRDQLASVLPNEWLVTETGCFMESESAPVAQQQLPSGYEIELICSGTAKKIEIRTESGFLAASGYAAETRDAFIYDRIETHANHRRRGLGRAVMSALGACRESPSVRQLLVATPQGEKLYLKMGWRTVSAYSTAQLLAG